METIGFAAWFFIVLASIVLTVAFVTIPFTLWSILKEMRRTNATLEHHSYLLTKEDRRNSETSIESMV